LGILVFTPSILATIKLISKKITMGTATISWLKMSVPGVMKAATNKVRT
jgi:hypothetical protein